MKGLVDQHCRRCVYRGSWPGNALKYCRYLEMTGTKRPCPAGTGCTVKTTRRVHHRKKKGITL